MHLITATLLLLSGFLFSASSQANSHITTPHTVVSLTPGQVTGLQVYALDQQSLMLEWESPLEIGDSTLTDYQLERATDADFTADAVSMFMRAQSLATTYIDTSLTAGDEYFYRVRAINSNGNGAFSVPASATPNSGLPTAVATISTAEVADTHTAPIILDGSTSSA
ncbi:MAG: fibronectin type III domain-containing protein, partial [Methylococcales symbiont of Hymedesmia sp. n. MRB-2018]